MSKMKKRWTAEELKTAVRMAKKGFTNQEIGERIGREENAVAKKLHRMGYKRSEKVIEKLKRLKYIEFTDAQMKQLESDYQSSLRIEEIERIYGVSEFKIKELAKANGWGSKRRGVNKDHEDRLIPFTDLFNAYFVECLPIKDILKRFKCSDRVFYRSMNKYELSLVRNIHERRAMRAEADEASRYTKTRKTIHEMRKSIEVDKVV